MHCATTGKTARDNMDPSRFFCFLVSIQNSAISDKISHSIPFPRNLQECFEGALSLEAGSQLLEDVNLTTAAK